MWSLVVVERDPISNSTAGVREAFEALAVDALLFERALHHSVLLRTMRRDEFLLQTVAANERQALRSTGQFHSAKLSLFTPRLTQTQCYLPSCRMSRFSLGQYTDADKLLLVEYDLPVRYTRETVDHHL